MNFRDMLMTSPEVFPNHQQDQRPRCHAPARLGGRLVTSLSDADIRYCDEIEDVQMTAEVTSSSQLEHSEVTGGHAEKYGEE